MRGKPTKKPLTNRTLFLKRHPSAVRPAGPGSPRLIGSCGWCWWDRAGSVTIPAQPQLCGLLGWAAGPHGSSPSSSWHHSLSPAAKGCHTLPVPYSRSGTWDVQGLGTHSLRCFSLQFSICRCTWNSSEQVSISQCTQQTSGFLPSCWHHLGPAGV